MATRNDLGALASMHNKLVRNALVRLRLSIQEWLGELPPETGKLPEEVTGPGASPPAARRRELDWRTCQVVPGPMDDAGLAEYYVSADAPVNTCGLTLAG